MRACDSPYCCYLVAVTALLVVVTAATAAVTAAANYCSVDTVDIFLMVIALVGEYR